MAGERRHYATDKQVRAAAPDLYAALKAIVDAEEAAFAEWRRDGAPEWKPGHPAFDRYNAARAALSLASPSQEGSPDA